MNRTRSTGVVFGVFIILLGALLLANSVFGISLRVAASVWWGIVILFLAVLSMANSRVHFWNALLFLFGAWLIVHRTLLAGFPHAGAVFFGGAVMLVGCWIVFSSVSHRTQAGVDDRSFPEYECIFADSHYENRSQAFAGARMESIFGRMRADLTGISLQGNAVIDASAVFGTLEIVMPRNIPYRTSVVPVFGSFRNEAPVRLPNGTPYIEIKGAAVFGTVRLL